MLDFLRQQAGSWLVKIVLGAIILVFIFWGVGSFRSRRADVLAKVNGQVITLSQYNRLYSQRLEQLHQMFQGQLDEQLLKQLNIPGQVFEELVRRVLLSQAAHKMGIKVLPDEIRIAISQIHAFQSNGHFDRKKYQAVLRQLRILPQDFEEDIKSQLLETKLKQILTTPIVATSLEAKEKFIFENEKLKIGYVTLKIDDYKRKVKIDEKKLKNYFNLHKAFYKTPLKVKVTYYLLRFDQFKDKIKVTPQEIKEYYELHKNTEFSTKKGYIPLKKVQEKIAQKLKLHKIKEMAWDKANKMYDDILLLGGLEKWAQKEKLSLKKTSFFSIKNPPPGPLSSEEVLNSLSKLEEGELGPPVEVSQGILFFKVAKIDQPHIPPLKEVKKAVLEDFLTSEARKLCRQEAQELLAKLQKSSSPVRKILKTKRLKWQETNFFARKEALEKSGLPLPVSRAIQSLGKVGQWIEQPIFTDKAFYLVKLVALKAPDMKAFSKEEKNLKLEITKEKRQEAFFSWYKHLREIAQIKLYRELPKP